MNQADARRFREVTPNTELVDVRPTELNATLHGPPPEAGAPIELSIRSSIRLERSSPEEFAVAARFIATASRKDGDEPQEYVRFVYAAAAKYRLSDPSFTDEDLQPFARYNSMIHLWPYFRAFVQSACGQMNISPIVIPVFRVPGERSADAATAHSTEREAAAADS